MKKWILNRLKEPSTWRGLIAIATACGVQLAPDQINAIVAVGLALIGLVGTFTPDKIVEPPPTPPTPVEHTDPVPDRQ